MPFGAASDLHVRFEQALERLRTAAIEAAPHDPVGAEFDRWLLRYRLSGSGVIVASIVWASIITVQHPEPSGLHFLPWIPATTGFILLLRDASFIVRWAGSALFGVIATLLPHLLAEWLRGR